MSPPPLTTPGRWTIRHRKTTSILPGFGVVGQKVSDDALRFKVEAQTDKSSYELCYCPLHETNRDCKSLERICRDVSVGITELSGVLYFVAPADAPRTVFHYFRDLARQRVELSVAEGDPKVYREVLIEAPKGNPDCRRLSRG